MINQAADLLRFVTAMQSQLAEDMEGLLNDVEKYDLPKSVEQGIKSVNSALKNVSLQNIISSISAVVL